MSKAPIKPVDVLVLGEHPCAFLAAALLRIDRKLRVVHAPLAGESSADRLVLVNPGWFSLAKSLEPLRRKLNLTPIYGTQFLCGASDSSSTFKSKSALAYIADLAEVRESLRKIAAAQDVEWVNQSALQIHQIDENGAELTLGKTRMHPKVLILAGALSASQSRMIGLHESWGMGIVHRYSFAHLPAPSGFEAGSRPLMPMALDLKGKLCWAWLFPFQGEIQLAVEQPVETIASLPPAQLMEHWLKVLQAHEILPQEMKVPSSAIRSVDMPLAGALEREGVANRALMIGPAGGFQSACAEDLYPTCWSAVYAADVVRKAIRETHLQDALQPFRHNWRTTLGDYLRGPQQNLRFLLPLVYRNPVMAARLAEAILLGKGVVR